MATIVKKAAFHQGSMSQQVSAPTSLRLDFILQERTRQVGQGSRSGSADLIVRIHVAPFVAGLRNGVDGDPRIGEERATGDGKTPPIVPDGSLADAY